MFNKTNTEWFEFEPKEIDNHMFLGLCSNHITHKYKQEIFSALKEIFTVHSLINKIHINMKHLIYLESQCRFPYEFSKCSVALQ